MASESPKLEIGQYALIHYEVLTGIITLSDGRRHISDDTPIGSLPGMEKWAGRGKLWLVFDSLAEAKDYAQNKINELPTITCEICDHNRQTIERLRNEDYVSAYWEKSKKMQAEHQNKWHKKLLKKISKWF